MTAQEVKDIISASGKKVIKVEITTKSGKKYKQSLRINPQGILCIGQYKSNFPNYLIYDSVTDNWSSIKIC